jgi:hypothetical protein
MGAPWFKLYAKDYLGDPKVRMLSDSDRGVLVDCWAIQTEIGGVPTDPVSLGKLLNRRPDHALRAFLRVACFFVHDPLKDGFMVSLRLLSEQAAYSGKVLANQLNGSKGGRPKKNPLGSNKEPTYGNPQVTEPEPEPELEKDKSIKTVPRKRVTKPKEVESLDAILDGKGSPLWETYWELAGLFGPSKNPSPKITAKLYRLATQTVESDHIQQKAVELAKATSEQKYLPQLAKWLEGEGYQNPTQIPLTGGTNGSRSPKHRAETDAAYIAHLGDRAAQSPSPSGGTDKDLSDLWEQASSGGN